MRERLRFAEIAAVTKPKHGRVAGVDLLDDAPGRIAGAVVHKEDLVGQTHPGERAGEPLVKRHQVALLVHHGDEDGQRADGYRTDVDRKLGGVTGHAGELVGRDARVVLPNQRWAIGGQSWLADRGAHGDRRYSLLLDGGFWSLGVPDKHLSTCSVCDRLTIRGR